MVASTLRSEVEQVASASRWIGVGRASTAEPSMGSHALRLALAGRTPALVIAFASSELDLPLLAEALRRSVEAETPVVGCTTAGEISSDGPTDGGVVVVA